MRQRRKTVVRLVEKNEVLNLRIIGAVLAEKIKNNGGL